MGKKTRQVLRNARNNWNDQSNGTGNNNNLSKGRKARKAKKKGQNVEDSSYLNIEEKVNKVNKTLLDVEGDGNCMFRSLSHQLYGVQDKHTVLRQQVCDYLVDNKQHFVMFFATNEDDEETFEQHITRMRSLGTYGDQIELVAFANLFKVDLHIYQNDLDSVMTIQGQTIGETKVEGDNGKDFNQEKMEKPTLHLAYHTWEHYSSVVDLDPNSKPQMVYEEDSEGDDPSYKHPKTSTQKAKEDVIIQRQIDRIVIKTKFEDEEVIEKLLKENNLNLTKVTKLIKKHYSDLVKENKQEFNSELKPEQLSNTVDIAVEALADENQLQISHFNPEYEASVNNNNPPEKVVHSETIEQEGNNDSTNSPSGENISSFEDGSTFSHDNVKTENTVQLENPTYEIDQIEEDLLSVTEYKQETDIAAQKSHHPSKNPTAMEGIPNQLENSNNFNHDGADDVVNSNLITSINKTNQKGKRIVRKDKKLPKKMQKNTKFNKSNNNNKGSNEGQNIPDTPTKSLSKEISYIQL